MYKRILTTEERKKLSASAVPPFRADAVEVLLQPELADHPDFHDGWGGLRLRSVPLESAREPTLVVTHQDTLRLREVLEEHRLFDDVTHVELLEAALGSAVVVDARSVPPQVVTMNSRVVFEDEETGLKSVVQLVYPHDTHVADDHVSVLAPMGSALLGATVGQAIAWPSCGRERLHVRVHALPYQPERAGHFHL